VPTGAELQAPATHDGRTAFAKVVFAAAEISPAIVWLAFYNPRQARTINQWFAIQSRPKNQSLHWGFAGIRQHKSLESAQVEMNGCCRGRRNVSTPLRQPPHEFTEQESSAAETQLGKGESDRGGASKASRASGDADQQVAIAGSRHRVIAGSAQNDVVSVVAGERVIALAPAQFPPRPSLPRSSE
jgi:hypothetical protein